MHSLRSFGLVGQQPRAVLLNGVRDVLEEVDSLHDVLVLSSVQRATERIGLRRQLGLVAGCRAVARLRVYRCCRGSHYSLYDEPGKVIS